MTLHKTVKHNLILVLLIVSICFCIYFWQGIHRSMLICVDKLIDVTDAHIKTVTIIGASPKVEKLIRANLGLNEGNSIFSLSTTKMLKNLSKIGWIKEASIHKILPNIIKINIKERVPIAVYHHEHKYSLIDETGVLIDSTTSNPGLPLVSGTNANIRVHNILKLIRKYPKIKIHSLMYIHNRRWNLILKNKVTVKLPSVGIENSLKVLSKIIEQKNIEHSVTAIDLRSQGNVIICGLKPKK